MRLGLRKQQREREKLQREYARSQQGRPLGIYLHIPFCKSKCAYCDFYSLAHREGDWSRYCDALKAHLRETAPQARGRIVDTIYIGGGTPSLLGGRAVAGLLRTIRRLYRLSPACEITMEANPDSVTESLLRTVRRSGVNRLSLGVQCADDSILQTLRRPHTFAQAKEAVSMARRAGFQNLSLDLIYGLPGQTSGGWQDTVEQVLALEPEHLSCYGLQLEEGTWLFDHQGEFTIPDDDQQADLYLWTVERLRQAGFAQYEISNFARPGRESRHNLRYWRMEEYIGFGPGAHSDFGGRRYSFVRDLDAYLTGIEQGGALVDEDQEIDETERCMEYVMLSLRTVEGIDLDRYARRFHMDPRPLQELFQDYARRALAQQEDGRWHLTPEGFLLSNTLIVQLLEARKPSTVESLLDQANKETEQPRA